MSNKNRASLVAGLIFVATAFAVVAVSLPNVAPDTNRPVVTPSAPQGNRPVGPGSYTSIPDTTAAPAVPQPAPSTRYVPTTSAGYRPVAPGAYSSIPDGSIQPQPAPEPTSGSSCPPGLQPVAPGSVTCIPEGN